MKVLDWAVRLSVGVCCITGLAYLVADFVLDLQTVTCFGRSSGIRPLVEHQLTRDVSYVFGVTARLERVETAYQTVEVYSHPYFGHILVIDGSLQITERDEANYHEMMAHLPLAYMPQATQVLMIGGGDGGALQRVLQHDHIRKAVLVDIDMRVMRELSRKYFPNLYQAYTDPRMVAHNADGAQWLTEQLADKANHASYDLILVDSTDYGAAETLFTDDFYRDLHRLLKKENSALVVNVDSPSWNLDIVLQVQRQVASLFTHCYVYHAHQPSFLSGHYAFLFASDSLHPMKSPVDWAAWHRKEIPTYYYTPDVHFAAFALPALLQKQLPAATLRELPPGAADPGPRGA